MHWQIIGCKVATLIAVAVFAAPATVLSHGGGLDEHGCHNSSKTGRYHCHQGSLDGHSFRSQQHMLHQRDNISGGHTRGGNQSHAGYQEYDRDLYDHWVDWDGDCMDVRDEVLAAESEVPVITGPDGCDVERGRWTGPYTGKTFTDPGELHVDHLVPLAEAHRSGAFRWSHAKRRQYANDVEDPRTLIAVEAGANMSKGARGPSEWLPENRAYRCQYVRDWQGVKKSGDCQ